MRYQKRRPAFISYRSAAIFQALVYRKNKEKLEERRPEKIIINKLMRHFSLDEQQAKNYYDKYAKEGNYGSLSAQS